MKTVIARTVLLLAGTTLASGLASTATAQTAPAGGGFSPAALAARLGAQPGFPQQPKAPKGAPNVLIVLLDDVGFAASSAFGGLIPTPNIDKLAEQGVRYNRFHTTAICSPTRAALLTGRNHHQVGFGNLADIAAGTPAYDSVWKPETASIARILQSNGYSTAAFGKWHNTPRWEVSAAGPFDRWPTGLGFDHFYGFQGGEDNQWEPHLYNDTTPIAAPATPEQGYHLTTDLVDRTIAWVDDHNAAAATKPYFAYFAPGATHMPHHVLEEWIAKNKGKFDNGWDKYRKLAFARQKKLGIVPQDAQLTPRPEGLPEWSSLSQEERRLYARQMEVYAGFLEQTDAEVGRLIDELKARPGGDNLLIFYIIGDNGGSSEGGLQGSIAGEAASAAGAPHDVATQTRNLASFGGPDLANHYAAGWAWATTTPFQWMKQVASHFGGTRNPLVVSWTGHTADPGQVRTQFGHVNDIAPTILDAAGIPFPAEVDGVRQTPFEGQSLVPTFTNAKAPDRHTTQYFEIFGNRSIYKDGWVAAAKRKFAPWTLIDNITQAFADDTATDNWELYNVVEDFSEARDLAKANPAKLEELKGAFASEGKRNGVFPLLPLPFGAPTIVDANQKLFSWRPGISTLPQNGVPELTGRSHRVEIDIKGDSSKGTGALVAFGGRLGGFVLYAGDGHLQFENNAFGQQRDRVTSTIPLPAGPATVGFEFIPDSADQQPFALLRKLGGGKVRLFVNGNAAGELAVRQYPTAVGSFNEGFDIGRDTGSPVSDETSAQGTYSQALGETRIQLK
ncbi:arylsulfatase [Altererythrobacter fulvus]|uniref:arylsulfatase n=1 Tax=Caenibius fulvus TaxID=2126012 RepID=UPI003018B2BC